MQLTTTQILITMFVIMIGTMITRFTPFLLFPESKEPPQVIQYLGKVLPPAMMGLLVIYCLKSIDFLSENHGVPELVSILLIILLHKWKDNVLLSILGGTVCYMIFVQFIF
ncbi:MAG: branched-chain amino acid transporter permease [Lachnospiraceae bacterium]